MMFKRAARRWVALVGAASLVAACGGGGSGGSSLYGGGTTTPTPTGPVVTSVDVISSLPEVNTGGAAVTVSAIVKGTGNVSLASSAVAFKADTGTLSEVSTTTDAAGVATAKLSAGADRTNRSATVTVTAGTVSNTVTVNVVGTTFKVSGATTLQLNGSTVYSVKVTDGAGAVVANAPVTVASKLGNPLSSTSLTTDSQGTANVTYTAATSGSDTVTFTGLGVSATTPAITISGLDFAFSSPAANATIAVDTVAPLVVTYKSNGAAQPGVTVNFTATAGQLTALSQVTDASGQATVSIQSATASPATVQATLVDGSGAAIGSATLQIQFVATTPARLVLQLTPTALAPNASGSTTNQAQVIARVTDANGNPVAGKTVNFSRDIDPSGGNLTQASAVTDLSGQATAQFVSGQTATASDGVVLRGTVSGTSVTGKATLTVSQAALFIALGTGNTITNIDPQTYKKDYTVYVTDANSVAVPNVSLTIRALPQQYGKGSMAYNGTVWAVADVGQTIVLNPANGNIAAGQRLNCINEDRLLGDSDPRSYNGVLDAGEDANQDGILQPGNVISVTPGTLTTDSTGRATLSLIYAESYAPWVQISLQVQAIVSGTASTTKQTFYVSGAAEDFTDESVPPAGRFSPFGQQPSCGTAN